jgi:hypothetical protein
MRPPGASSGKKLRTSAATSSAAQHLKYQGKTNARTTIEGRTETVEVSAETARALPEWLTIVVVVAIDKDEVRGRDRLAVAQMGKKLRTAPRTMQSVPVWLCRLSLDAKEASNAEEARHACACGERCRPGLPRNGQVP